MNLFSTVLFTVCGAVTVECCVLYPCCVGVFGMFSVMKGRRLFSNVFAITEKRDMDLYEVPLSMSLLGFGVWTMLANIHIIDNNNPYVWYYVVVNSTFRYAPDECKSKSTYVSGICLSEPCELLCLHCFIASLELSCGECNVISL